MRRRRSENAVRDVPILVSREQRHAGLAGRCDAADQIKGFAFTWIDRDPTADRRHGIEHRARASRQRRAGVERNGIGSSAAATDEAQAISLVGDAFACQSGRNEQMEHPRRGFTRRLRTASTQDRLALAQDLRLDKQFAECRMRSVGGWKCEHDLRVARDFEYPARRRTVADTNSAQLDVVIGRDGDFSARLDTGCRRGETLHGRW